MPVVEQWSPTNAIATDHPMHAGFDPGELLADADVVLVLDVPVPWVPSRQRPAPGAAVIQIGPIPTSSICRCAVFRRRSRSRRRSARALGRRSIAGCWRVAIGIGRRGTDRSGAAATRRAARRVTERDRRVARAAIARAPARSMRRRLPPPPRRGSAVTSIARSRPSSSTVAPGSFTSSAAIRR